MSTTNTSGRCDRGEHAACNRSSCECPCHPTYTISDSGKSITCCVCGMTSFNLNDVEQKFCGKCHFFHEDKKR
jgi:hypothetical protein